MSEEKNWKTNNEIIEHFIERAKKLGRVILVSFYGSKYGTKEKKNEEK